MRNTKSTPNTEMTKNTKNSEDLDNSHHPEEMSKISVDILTENFATLARAKGGIPKLRETILQLAVQGRLVGQDPADEPASVMLERIQQEKARLVREKTIKKAKALPPVDADEVPYALPEGWEWTRFGTILSEVQPGFACGKRDNDGGIIQLRMNNVNTKGKFIWEKIIKIPKDYSDKIDFFLLEEGDVLFNNTNSTDLVGKSARFDHFNEPVVFSNHFTRLRVADENPDTFFIALWLNHLWQNGYFKNLCNKWINQSAVNREKLINIAFPLPPLPEQHRIVERVDTLMALCDELEARQDVEGERRRMLLESVLHALQDGTDPEGVAAAREIFAANFDLLVDDTESIAELRKTILQLAVQGRLVDQDPADEPASVLLERISAEKARLVKEKKIKKAKGLPPVDADEVPYALPEGWVWTRLDDLSYISTGSTPSRTNSDYYQCGTIPWVTSSLTSLDCIEESKEHITEIALKECKLKIYPIGTLLVALYGQGKTRGQVSELKIESTINQACAAVVFFKNQLNVKEYVKTVLIGNYENIRSISAGGAQPNLNISKIKNTYIPLPPIAEQHRIVERVDALMALCDELEARVRAQEDAAERLLASVCDGICG